MSNFAEYSNDVAIINSFLNTKAFESCDNSIVLEAMKYSIENGGKRIRPLLTLYFSDLVGGNRDVALKLGSALEMIHTYSLIHDDLPCMDNDEMRRGKPSCHIAFGEANALLAGDALLTEAFYLAANSGANPHNLKVAIETLSKCAGIRGMVMGQVLDLEFEKKTPTLDQVKKMYSLKTCELLKCACILGCLTGENIDNINIKLASNYAENLGLAFQIIDDILDIVSDTETLGKPVGSDEKNNKPTFVKLYGFEKSKELVNTLTNNAIKDLKSFNGDSSKLINLTLELAERKY